MGATAANLKSRISYPEHFEGDAHGALLHPPEANGNVIVARRTDKWRQYPFQLADLDYQLRQAVGEADIFLTQQRFWGRTRRIAHLRELGACYVDVDFHKTKRWGDADPRYVRDSIIETLEAARLPDPWILHTGRGILCFWAFNPQPRNVLPRWHSMQKTLMRALNGHGVDAGATDAARVFRVAGSVNGTSGCPVSLLHRPSTHRWDFEDLAREVLPLERSHLVSLRAARARKRAEGQSETSPNKRLTAATLWEGRLTELQQLLHIRWFGALPEGQRDLWLYTAANAMSWLSPPAVLEREANALAKQVAGWSDRECRSRLSAVINRAYAAYRGEGIEYGDEVRDPRYRMTAQYIVDVLGVTRDEMEEGRFRYLVDTDRARELDAERKRAQRREAGVDDRESYESRAEARRRRVLELRAAGLTHRAVAAELGIAEKTSRNIANTAGNRDS